MTRVFKCPKCDKTMIVKLKGDLEVLHECPKHNDRITIFVEQTDEAR